MTPRPRPIIVATANEGKLREIRQLLGGLPFELSSLRDRWDPVPRIPETGATFEENARQKARWVFGRTGVWTLADDSGLEVDALGGAPGVRSARYAGEGAGDRANLDKLLGQLAGTGREARGARFRCAAVLMTSRTRVLLAEGVCHGRIAESPAGTGGFGYDPVFVPDGYARTFGELDERIKNAISHRGQALERLRAELVRLYG